MPSAERLSSRCVFGIRPRSPQRPGNRVQRQGGRTNGDRPFEHVRKLRVTRTPLRVREPTCAVRPPIRIFPGPLRACVPRSSLHVGVVGIGRLVRMLPGRGRAAQPGSFPTGHLCFLCRRVPPETPSHPPLLRIVLSSIHFPWSSTFLNAIMRPNDNQHQWMRSNARQGRGIS